MSHLSRIIIKNRINSIICRIHLYSIHVFAHLSRCINVMPSFDRFIVRSKITLQRNFSCTSRIVYRNFKILTDFCVILPVHMALSYVFELPQGICRPNITWLPIYDIIYQYLFASFGPSLFRQELNF